eukprot:comp4284_c0_seq1/m.2761 comp4284_c0_seq1/g.2761  ORF comp4284_c0_seq1/g.2761 comp4284_c0_seq1/m.2761 type:complete len:132 (+) comp4284_c0_seq1:87-482(+)
MNFLAALFFSVHCFLNGEAVAAYHFCMQHPRALFDIMLFSFGGAIGQASVFFMLAHFSALLSAAVTTTRKFFTILLSVVVFGHPLAPEQWLGVLFVLFGILLSLRLKENKKVPHSEETQLLNGTREDKDIV